MVSNSQKILKIDPSEPLPARAWALVQAALQAGELVVLPTETVYGVAARNDEAGREALARAKGRDRDKPIALLADQLTRFEEEGLSFNGLARRLADACWPGPLTMVVEGPRGSEGTRIPDHPVALNVLKTWARPLAVTSANRSGDPPALTAGEAVEALGTVPTVVLDAGPAVGKEASTVIRITDDTFEVLREGVLSGDKLRTFIGE